MEGPLLPDARAFVIVRRPGGAVLCTVEGDALGIPGGKWEPEAGDSSWERLAAREYEKAVGAPLPVAEWAGRLECGLGATQARFLILSISAGVADMIPTGRPPDSGNSASEVRWVDLRSTKNEGFLALATLVIGRDTFGARARAAPAGAAPAGAAPAGAASAGAAPAGTAAGAAPAGTAAASGAP